jgi:Protein of unknown function (DUF2865)
MWPSPRSTIGCVSCEGDREGYAVPRSFHFPSQLVAMRIATLAAGLLLIAAPPAHAGFLDFLFGGWRDPGLPPGANSYAEPPAGPIAPGPSVGTGHSVAFCVRLCDGQHFPLEHSANATPVETCRAMCPASKTKVFFGSEIDHAVASDGAHYADLDSAFLYRQRLAPDCTCNGKSAAGLAPVDIGSDPTLRPGDIVATTSGFEAYAGKHGRTATFTPVNSATVAAELNPTSASRMQMSRRGKEPAVADEEPGIIVPRAENHQAER